LIGGRRGKEIAEINVKSNGRSYWQRAGVKYEY